ncbi:hypothetical protein M6B38_154470 [Iris pallida]|uniref:Uncharacterized protein n=1 Tax=Iris pallida TaxID=29817 RepID=A0AAX6F4Y5_IRIPA|nr:hypothetical protein M6B38_154470 [Iris pallida]
MSRKGCTKENFYKGKILSLQPTATMRLQLGAAVIMRRQSPCAVIRRSRHHAPPTRRIPPYLQQLSHVHPAQLCASLQPNSSSQAHLAEQSPVMCRSSNQARPINASIHKAFNPLAGTKEEKSTANAVARGGFERASKAEGRP